MNFIQGTATEGEGVHPARAETLARTPPRPLRLPAENTVGALTVQGLPLIKPPYGRITATDLDRGEIA